MTYRIFSRTPFEATSPYEPTSITRLERDGIRNVAYALRLARFWANKEENYDIDFEVVDDNGRAVYAHQLFADAHVHAYKMNRDYGIDADFPF